MEDQTQVPAGDTDAKVAALQERIVRLQAEARALRKENRELKAKAGEPGGGKKSAGPGRPRFRMAEGTRDELVRTGHSRDPWTGAALTRDDLD